MSRRRFGAISAGTVMALGVHGGGAGTVSADTPRLIGTEAGSLLDKYFRGFSAILNEVIARESDAIQRAAEAAAACVQRGGGLFQTILGHLFYKDGGETGPGRIGNPVLFRRGADGAKPGDFLLTMSPVEAKRERERGLFVVGLTSPYFLHEGTPPLALAENAAETLRNPGNLMLAGVCDITIRTHVPVVEGIIDDPRFSTPLIPATSQITAVIYWAIAGETAVRIASGGGTVHVAGG